MAVVESISVCRLGGFEGSNPELVSVYPSLATSEDDLISTTMPSGTEPGTFISNRVQGLDIFSYSFQVRSEQVGTRDDLVSIAIVVSDKKVNIDQVGVLFKEIVSSLEVSGNLTNVKTSKITQMLERIYNSVNKSEKLKVDAITVDIPQIIKQKKLNIFKKDLTDFSGAF